MIINILGPQAAGYYTNFFSLLLAYSLVITPILTLVFPIATELITKNDHSKLKEFQNILYKYFSVFALSIGGIFFAF
jgi:O-antigen/teichoic acid export membrane protein